MHSNVLNIQKELDRFIESRRTCIDILANKFTKVGFYDLKAGEKYKIYRNPFDIDNYCTGIVRQHNTICVIMDRYRFNSKQKAIAFRNNIKLSGDCYYYAYISKKASIQQAMEQRALDKILKQLVNDDFTW
jgi:hypothetical protein